MPNKAGQGGTWGSVMDSTKPTVTALDANDPNWSAGEVRELILLHKNLHMLRGCGRTVYAYAHITNGY